MNSLKLAVHGKINLTLDVIDKRADGYHSLRSVMQSIELADEIILEQQFEGIHLETNIKICPIEDNLAYKAAEAFFSAINIQSGVRIFLNKKIPQAAGLAGGSADAAGVLYGLNYLFSTKLSNIELTNIAVKIGADVPFCLFGGTMLAEGIGEELSPLLSVPDWTIVLIKPEESVSTAEIYKGLQAKDFGDYFTNPFIKELYGEQVELTSKLGNILETVTVKKIGAIETWKKRLLAGGALTSLMSGSGPAVFGFFSSYQKALDFYNRWQNNTQVIITKPSNKGITVLKNC